MQRDPAQRDVVSATASFMLAAGRLRVVLAAGGLLSALGYALGMPLVAGQGPRTHEGYVVLYLALFAVYLLVVRMVLRRPAADRRTLGIILGFALLFRLIVLPSPVILSSDLYRYLWDGRLQWSGVNPYRYPPAADALAPLRDPYVFPAINRPAEPTVYPPGAELVFALVAAVAPDSILGWRLFVLGCEAATIILLLRLLRRMNIAASAVLVYAWSPLAVFEGVQAGHVDFVMLPLLLVALGWRQTDRMVRVGLALAVAVLVKLYPAVLLLVWQRRGSLRLPAAFVSVFAAAYLAYGSGVGSGVMGFLPRYFGPAEDFNIGLRAFVTETIDWSLGRSGRAGLGRGAIELAERWGYAKPGLRPARMLSAEQETALRQKLAMPSGDLTEAIHAELGHQIVRGLTMLAMCGALGVSLLVIGWRRRPGPDGVFEASRAAVAAYLILLPTAMHAWYAAWILPFLAVRPSPAWFWFTGAVSLSYLKYAWDGLPWWIRALEFVPLYALLLWQWRARRVPTGSPPRSRAGASSAGP